MTRLFVLRNLSYYCHLYKYLLLTFVIVVGQMYKVVDSSDVHIKLISFLSFTLYLCTFERDESSQ